MHASSRSLASVAEVPSSSAASPSSASTSTTPNAVINAAVILNRSPILTRTPSLFERAYYTYQSRIRRALFNPFPTEFYFKTGSLLEKKFGREEKRREKEAFGGPWSLKRSDRGVEEDGELASIQVSPDQAVNMGEEHMDPPAPRTHEADNKGDVKSLDRLGERNLYLLVWGKDHTGKEVWRFPQGGLQDGELLHQVSRCIA